MFGYVQINKPELKVREYEIYRGYYCGLCQALHEQHGLKGRLTLTYDMTFLSILLTGLYEPKEQRQKKRCPMHPLEKHVQIQNEIVSYAADMNIALSYLKFLDNYKDEKKQSAKLGMRLFQKDFHRICKKYPEKMKRILASMKKLSLCEKRKESMLDLPAGYFGEVVAELFIYREDRWEPGLRRMGYFLGKYIYLADACCDVEEDFKDGNYNVFLTKWKDGRPYEILDAEGKATKEFQEEGIQILQMMMAECAREFERLPVLKNAQLLRNILYAGVWNGLSIGGRSPKKEKDRKVKK